MESVSMSNVGVSSGASNETQVKVLKGALEQQEVVIDKLLSPLEDRSNQATGQNLNLKA
jgi:hypothetical protein